MTREKLRDFFKELSKNEEYTILNERLQKQTTDLHTQAGQDFYTFVADRVNDLNLVHSSTEYGENDKKLSKIFNEYREKDKTIAKIEHLVYARDAAVANLLFMRGMREAVFMLIQVFDDNLLD
jgi:hypothetical protein